ncbi:hypothetical protein VTO42DRAFT_7529 [Malbranchea cinnamomea]
MSDPGRKDFTTQAKETMTPESTKSTQQKMKETMSDTADRLTRGVQPDEHKGGTQETFDKAQRSSDENVHGGSAETIGDKVKGALGMNK